MAAKTASFFIRKTIDCSSISGNVESLDTSAYVDPSDRQGLEIEMVDFVFYNGANYLPFEDTSNQIGVQVLAGTYGELQDLGEEDLIASAGISWDSTSNPSNATDMFPDALGISKKGRIVVDDTITIATDTQDAATNAKCCVILKCRVVRLTNKDFMALALQTVAN